MDGFALQEYVVPKTCAQDKPLLGTMPKAARTAGSVFDDKSDAAKTPAPNHYQGKVIEFVPDATGGKFSKMPRETMAKKSSIPPVCTYEPKDTLTTPRARLGKMPKGEKRCFMIDQALRDAKWKPSPGKYDVQYVNVHLKGPVFSSSKTESKEAKAVADLGPGQYTMNFSLVEKRAVCYSSGKEAKLLRPKAQELDGPGPIPEDKVVDRQGLQKHCRRLLADRIITPRGQRSA